MGTLKLGVEVVGARDLLPKDDEGAATTFVNLCLDNQIYQTTTIQSELNPVWQEIFYFNISGPNHLSEFPLIAEVYHREKVNSKSFLGRVSLSPEFLIDSYSKAEVSYYPLQENNSEVGVSGVKGELGLKVFTYRIPNQNLAHEPKDNPSVATWQLPVNYEMHEKDFIFSSDLGDETSPEDTSEYLVSKTSPYLGGGHVVRGRFESPDRPAASTYDLVETMHYLFVRVAKAQLDLHSKSEGVAGSLNLYVEAKIGNYKRITKHYEKRGDPEWNEVFVFPKDQNLLSSILDVKVKVHDHHQEKDDLVGSVRFDLLRDVATRVPDDSPLAPKGYQIRKEGEVMKNGELMLAVWFGTQADEAFRDGWNPDSCGSAAVNPHMMRSKVYYSPILWYVRVHVLEAQVLVVGDRHGTQNFCIQVKMGEQRVRTSFRSGSNTFRAEDLILVAAEPFGDQSLIVSVCEHRKPPDAGEGETFGSASIALNSVEKRYDNRTISAKWFDLENFASDAMEEEQEKQKLGRRILISVCIEGGYHVLDEPPNCSTADLATDKQLQFIGVVDLGIIDASGLHSMKTREGIDTSDTYCVAKYGHIWYRTRTIKSSLSPKYNEQYRWQVYDPATTLTVAVFDNTSVESNAGKHKPIGIVRIPISTLEPGLVYTLSYPLLTLGLSGVKKMGKLHLAIRFSCTSLGNMMLKYFQPLLPKMHYIMPLPLPTKERLHSYALLTVAARLGQAEPPLGKEVVQYILNREHNRFNWSMRVSKANFMRLMSVLYWSIGVAKWFKEVCMWKNTITTAQVHVLFVMLACNPTLILPTTFLYMSVIGLWNFLYRPSCPPCFDARLSQAHSVKPDEIDEEFDSFPSSGSEDDVRMRYDRLRSIAGRVQLVVGDMVTQGERILGLLSWRDPCATVLFIIFCLVAAILLWRTPFKVVVILAGVYFMRHPRFRSKVPSAPRNFLIRLPSKEDLML